MVQYEFENKDVLKFKYSKIALIFELRLAFRRRHTNFPITTF